MSEDSKNSTVAETTGPSILNFFDQQASSSELGEGVHERVKLVSIDPEHRRDKNDKIIKKQLFLKFKKFDKEGVDIGEIDISFFMIDASKDTAITNLHMFLSQTMEILSIFLPEDEITKNFDPLSVLYDAEKETRKEEEVIKDYTYDMIKKKVLKKGSLFTKVEKSICSQFTELLKDKIGFKSSAFRLKLEKQQDTNYVQIPRYDRFVEKSNVKKEKSVLYVNAK